jgi:hypothetical protein
MCLSNVGVWSVDNEVIGSLDQPVPRDDIPETINQTKKDSALTFRTVYFINHRFSLGIQVDLPCPAMIWQDCPLLLLLSVEIEPIESKHGRASRITGIYCRVVFARLFEMPNS